MPKILIYFWFSFSSKTFDIISDIFSFSHPFLVASKKCIRIKLNCVIPYILKYCVIFVFGFWSIACVGYIKKSKDIPHNPISKFRVKRACCVGLRWWSSEESGYLCHTYIGSLIISTWISKFPVFPKYSTTQP